MKYCTFCLKDNYYVKISGRTWGHTSSIKALLIQGMLGCGVYGHVSGGRDLAALGQLTPRDLLPVDD